MEQKQEESAPQEKTVEAPKEATLPDLPEVSNQPEEPSKQAESSPAQTKPK